MTPVLDYAVSTRRPWARAWPLAVAFAAAHLAQTFAADYLICRGFLALGPNIPPPCGISSPAYVPGLWLTRYAQYDHPVSRSVYVLGWLVVGLSAVGVGVLTNALLRRAAYGLPGATWRRLVLLAMWLTFVPTPVAWSPYYRWFDVTRGIWKYGSPPGPFDSLLSSLGVFF
jgi:hypothetical protein